MLTETKKVPYPYEALLTFFILLAITFFWPQVIPFGLFEFWHSKEGVWNGVAAGWPAYLWAFGATGFSVFFKRDYYHNLPREIFGFGTMVSLRAGLLEEISFRWIFFLGATMMFPLIDYIFLGFTGWHPIQIFYVGILAPIANFFTLGLLEPELTGLYGWAATAAIMSVNMKFRDGHVYLGWIGWINSWFLGMFFFWIMFHYGLLAAIIVHAIYDFIIFFTVFIDASVEFALYGRQPKRTRIRL